MARFVSKDRWGGDLENPQSLNKYSYTVNNPVKYVDPDGNRFLLPTWLDIFRVTDLGSLETPTQGTSQINPVLETALGVVESRIPGGKQMGGVMRIKGRSLGQLKKRVNNKIGNVLRFGTGKKAGKENISRGGPPRDLKTNNYLPDPKATGEHSTFGMRVGSDKNKTMYKQGATFSKDGEFVERVDNSVHRGDHPNPHYHDASDSNNVKKGYHTESVFIRKR